MNDSSFRNFTRNLYFDYLDEKRQYDSGQKPKSFSDWFISYKWFIKKAYRMKQSSDEYSKKWRNYFKG